MSERPAVSDIKSVVGFSFGGKSIGVGVTADVFDFTSQSSRLSVRLLDGVVDVRVVSEATVADWDEFRQAATRR